MYNHTEYMRKWRKENPEKVRAIKKRYRATHKEKNSEAKRRGQKAWEKRNREKHLAHRAIDDLVNRLRFQKPKNCQQCGAECLTQGHHEDYSKRYEVIWLCYRCHREKHPIANTG